MWMLIAITAGRLQNKSHLMEELKNRSRREKLDEAPAVMLTVTPAQDELRGGI